MLATTIPTKTRPTIQDAIAYMEFLCGKRPFEPRMNCIRDFLNAYDLTQDSKKNPTTYYLVAALWSYWSMKLMRVQVSEFMKWGLNEKLSREQIEFAAKVAEAWIQQCQSQPVSIEPSKSKETQIQTKIQSQEPKDIELAEPGAIALSDPGDIVIATTPEGLRLVEIINRSIATEGIRFKLLNVLDGVRVTEYRIIQDLDGKDKNGNPAPLLRPERIEALSSTLKVYARTKKSPIIFPGDGCIVVQVAKDTFEPVRIEKHVGKYFSGRCDRPLSIPCGIGMSRELVSFELEGHALIGGQTRGGKTSEQDAIVFFLMNHYLPSQLRLVMIDPQKVNFADYDGLPWLYGGKVLTQKQEVELAINQVYLEVDRREELFLQKRARNFLAYNKWVTEAIAKKQASIEDYLPFIVFVIDEMAELVSLFNREEGEDGQKLMESFIQISRAYAKFGVHLILATQRPSKEAGGSFSPHLAANVGVRIAFRTADEKNSQIILGESYPMASRLAGKGDGYIVSPDREFPTRFQGFWADPDKVIKPWCNKFRGIFYSPNPDLSKGWSRENGVYPEELAIAQWEPQLFPIHEEESDPLKDAIARIRKNEPDISESALIEKLKSEGLLKGNWAKCQQMVRRHT